jgi:hypothetical protein
MRINWTSHNAYDLVPVDVLSKSAQKHTRHYDTAAMKAR